VRRLRAVRGGAELAGAELMARSLKESSLLPRGVRSWAALPVGWNGRHGVPGACLLACFVRVKKPLTPAALLWPFEKKDKINLDKWPYVV